MYQHHETELEKKLLAALTTLAAECETMIARTPSHLQFNVAAVMPQANEAIEAAKARPATTLTPEQREKLENHLGSLIFEAMQNDTDMIRDAIFDGRFGFRDHDDEQLIALADESWNVDVKTLLGIERCDHAQPV